MKRPKRLRAEVRALIEELESSLELLRIDRRSSVSNPEVSSWTVVEHLDHVAAVDLEILQRLQKIANGTATGENGRPTLVGRLVLMTGAIPRGKGQAPDSFRPTGRSLEAIIEAMNEAHSMASALDTKIPNLSSSPTKMRHFAFGHLNAYQWIRLAHIHHRHHRRIIEYILEA